VRAQLGLRKWLEDQGHEYVVTSDKEGSESLFQKHIVDVGVSSSLGCSGS
jgi:formate dehydrogenase